MTGVQTCALPICSGRSFKQITKTSKKVPQTADITPNGVKIGTSRYVGDIIVPNTGGKTANQLRQGLQRQYLRQGGDAKYIGYISGSFNLNKNLKKPSPSSGEKVNMPSTNFTSKKYRLGRDVFRNPSSLVEGELLKEIGKGMGYIENSNEMKSIKNLFKGSNKKLGSKVQNFFKKVSPKGFEALKKSNKFLGEVAQSNVKKGINYLKGEGNKGINYAGKEIGKGRSYLNKNLKKPSPSWMSDLGLGKTKGEAIGSVMKPLTYASEGVSALLDKARSEERRVGKECRSRWSPYH